MNHRINTQAGFSLLELLVVLVILGLLGGIVGVNVLKNVDKGKYQATRTQLLEIAGALDLYRLEVGRYPTTDEGLAALLQAPGNTKSWNGPYLRRATLPADSWTQPFHYRAPGEHGDYDLYSLGADNAPGGEKYNRDIVSWE